MGRQTITSEQWLAAVASVDDNPAVRAMARETLDELRSIRQQLAQADQFGRGEFTVTRDAHDRALRALDRLRGRDEKATAGALTVLDEALSSYWGCLTQTAIDDVMSKVRDALGRAHEDATINAELSVDRAPEDGWRP